MSTKPTREQVYETLYQEHLPQIRQKLLYRFSSLSPDDLEDVLQTALLRVYQALEKGEIASPASYLYVVATHLVSQTLKGQTERLTLDEGTLYPSYQEPLDSRLSVDALLRAFEVEITLLPPRQQVTLILSKQGKDILSLVANPAQLWEQVIGSMPEKREQLYSLFPDIPLEDEQIALLLDVTPNNVRVLRHRAIASLKQIVERYNVEN